MTNKNEKLTQKQIGEAIQLSRRMQSRAIEAINHELDHCGHAPKIKKQAATEFAYAFGNKLLIGLAQKIILGRNEKTTRVRKAIQKFKKEQEK